MKCPHCLVDFNDGQTLWSMFLGRDAEAQWFLTRRTCPTCNKFIFHLDTGIPVGIVAGQPLNPGQPVHYTPQNRAMVRPRGISRSPVPDEVPAGIAEDYKEACLVLVDSPKASAALSRRCLQSLLRLAAGVKPGDLSVEIQQVLDSGKLPQELADNIDAIRNIGNFAAHPNKSKSSGEVVPVEPHEAEWNLEVLESLFDHFFVQPAKNKARRAALNLKLGDAGKPAMK